VGGAVPEKTVQEPVNFVEKVLSEKGELAPPTNRLGGGFEKKGNGGI